MTVKFNTETPIHNNLWYSGFVMLALAGFLLTLSAYMLMALLPLHIGARMASSAVICQEQLLCAVTYALGLFAFGPFCNWLTQRYRRGLVCVRAIEGYTLCVAASWLVLKNPQWAIPLVIEVLRFFTAACYGLAAIVLFGTLIVDKTESVYRTRANHSAAWLARLGIALGPLTAIVLFRHTSAADVCLWAALAGFASAVLVRLVRFPFKTPEDDVPHMSFDRFMLGGEWHLFLFTALSFACYGYVLTMVSSVAFFTLVMVGFLWALLTERFMGTLNHAWTDLFVAFFFILSAMSVFCSPSGMLPGYFTPCLLGGGVGMVGARSQLMLITRSDHCRRGTAISTFFLASEWGVAVGMLIGIAIKWA